MPTREVGSKSNEGRNKIHLMIAITLIYMFLKVQPSKFCGTTNPSELEEQVRETEKIFLCPCNIQKNIRLS